MTTDRIIALIIFGGIIFTIYPGCLSTLITVIKNKKKKVIGVPKTPNPPPMPEPVFVQVQGISELYTYSKFKEMPWFYEIDIVAVWRRKKAVPADRGNSNTIKKTTI